jgi:hypothetical protein
VKQRDDAIVRALEGVLERAMDREVQVGERVDLAALLRQEMKAGYKKVGIVACGPGSLCDEVRAIVCNLARHEKTHFEFEVDQFGW